VRYFLIMLRRLILAMLAVVAVRLIRSEQADGVDEHADLPSADELFSYDNWSGANRSAAGARPRQVDRSAGRGRG